MYDIYTRISYTYVVGHCEAEDGTGLCTKQIQLVSIVCIQSCNIVSIMITLHI